ncbi:hypothetical protein GH714_003071 [Hevea brasiliensis]|uniref:RING-type E3 ubiquitin transferase n=1 Tax=Hevea brasiliensis TaxID=3981 RepID=A0A6A6LXG1_HEVBR|nr:hypothetical protein GH714_003071 [Hevea brasiliensis]
MLAIGMIRKENINDELYEILYNFYEWHWWQSQDSFDYCLGLLELAMVISPKPPRKEATLRPSSPKQAIGPDMESNVTVEPPKVGLDPLIIASFPTVAYKPTNQQELNHGEPIECSVCLGTIVEDAMVRILPNCKHMFHVECIDMWLGSNTTCPICRTVAEPRVQPVGRELGSSEFQAQVQPSAPPLAGGSGSLFGSFRWMVTRERSSRARSCGDEVGVEDLERV